jgi:hypothetical protein
MKICPELSLDKELLEKLVGQGMYRHEIAWDPPPGTPAGGSGKRPAGRNIALEQVLVLATRDPE